MPAIRVELELADGSFTTRMLHAGQTVQQFTDAVGQSTPALRAMAAAGQPVIRTMDLARESTKSFVSTLRDVSVVAGLFSYGISKIAGLNKGWIADIVKINMEMERLTFQMRSMSTAVDPIKDAAKQMEFLRDQATEMPFALNTIADSFTKLKASGIDPLNGSLQSLADGVSAAGGTDESLKRVTLAISQISGKGVLQMEELRQQLGESMPRAAALLARSMGVSMSTLVQQISTGTVAAKPALKALFDELDRTYGGTAQRMMQTFAGQLQKTQTTMQKLVTGGTIQNNFYNGALRQQLEDINSFLDSGAAERMRDQLGNALAYVVTQFRNVLNAAFDFRNELMRIGEVIVTALALRSGVRGIQSVMEAIQGMNQAWRAAGIQAAISTQRWAEFDALARRSGGPMWDRARSLVGALGSTMQTVFMGFSAYAPLIAGVGLAAYTAAEYFGLFSNKVQEAYEKLKTFGAESRAEAERITSDYRAQLEARKAAIEEVALNPNGEIAPSYKEQYDDINRQLANFAQTSGQLIAEAGAKAEKIATEQGQKIAGGMLKEIQTNYDIASGELERKFDEQEAEAARKGNSVVLVQERRAKETLDLRRKTYEEQKQALQGLIDFQKEALKYAESPDKANGIKAVLADLNKQLTDVTNKMNDLKLPELVTTPKASNEDKLLKNAEALLTKMRSEAAGLQEELEGGSKQAGKLAANLIAGKFGSDERDEVKKIAEQLIAQAKVNDALKEAIRLRKLENRELDNGKEFIEKLRTEIEGYKAELAGGDYELTQLTEAVNGGKYGGPSSDEARKVIAQLKELIAEREKLKDQAKQLKESNQLFENGQNNLRQITADVKGMIGSFEGLNEKVMEMNSLLASGKYGSQDQERVLALRDALLDAIDAKEKLDKIMDAKQELERDVDAAYEKARVENMEAQIAATGRTMTEAEKILFKLDNGFYAGLGKDSKSEKALRDLAQAIAEQGTSADQLGEILKTKTFGADTVAHIDNVTMAIQRMGVAIGTAGSSLGGMDFSKLGQGVGTSIADSIAPVMQELPQQVTERMKNAMDYLMQKGWSRVAAAGIVGNLVGESNMNPNAIGDNGNAFGMAQWNSRGPEMKKFLADRGKAWNDFYGQLDFVDHELRGSEAKAGGRLLLSRDPAAAATTVMKDYERPANYSSGGIRAGAAQQAYNLAGNGPIGPVAPPQEAGTIRQTTRAIADQDAALERLHAARDKIWATQRARLEETDKVEKDTIVRKQNKARSDLLTELQDTAKKANVDIEDLGKNYKKVVDAIHDPDSKLGPSKDENDPFYKDLITAAKEADRVEEEIAKKRRARRDADSAQDRFAQRRAELERKAAEDMQRLSDPNMRQMSSGYRTLERELETYVADVKKAYDSGSKEAIAAEQYKQSMLRQFRNGELVDTMAGNAKKTQEIQRSFMTERQQRQLALEDAIRMIDQDVANFQGSEQEKVRFVAAAEAQKAALRRQAAEEANPMTRQMREWSDLQTNLAQASTRWMDSLAGGLTDLIMGTGDLKSVINGILKDMLNMGIKALMGSMMGGKGQTAGKAAGTAGKAGKGQMASAGKGKLGPGLHYKGGLVKKFAHFAAGGYTGQGDTYDPAGIVHAGEYVMSKRAVERLGVDTLEQIHKGALQGKSLVEGFASGGFVGGPSATPRPAVNDNRNTSQMRQSAQNMGAPQVSINAPVTVNANGGTPAQNDDLAKRVAKEMDQTMRGVVVDEMMKQMRPGNILNRGKF